MKFDYENLHSSMWENHKVSWTVTGLFIPIIFTLEGYFLLKYFQVYNNFPYWKQQLVFILGVMLIHSLAIIWYLIMSAFHDLNNTRIKRLQEIEDKLCWEDPTKKNHLVNHYNCIYPHLKKDESKEKVKKGISEFLQSVDLNYPRQTVSVKIKVKPVNYTIIWNNPADITYGKSLSDAQLNATASVPGTFTYDPKEGKVLDVGTHTLEATFIPKEASAKFIPSNSFYSTLSRLFYFTSSLLLALLSAFLWLVYVPLIMPLFMMTKYTISVDRWKMKKPWNVMNIYLLVVILLYSLNFFLLILVIIIGFSESANDLNLTINFTN